MITFRLLPLNIINLISILSHLFMNIICNSCSNRNKSWCWCNVKHFNYYLDKMVISYCPSFADLEYFRQKFLPVVLNSVYF